MKNIKLTNKQETILIFIKKYIAKNGYPPTVREIAASVNLSSPATVHVHLSNLIEKGFIRRSKKNHRMLELLVPNEFEQIISDEFDIPLIQNNKRNTTYKVLKSAINSYGDVVAFKMDNNDMKDSGILKGDILLFEKTNNITSKDIVLIDSDNIYLVKDDNIKQSDIVGRLIKLFREY